MEINQTIRKSNTASRPPVVVILGHVDHGKTTILNKIRQTRVAEKEAGGITQHIGAYQIEIPKTEAHHGGKITFLDTPGHEAFSAIRSRGAKVADIAVLVIAADEGVKPQTKEAIQVIKQAQIPFVVAINKIDKEGANPQRIKQELAEEAVMVEDYGGQIPIVELSAKTGQGLDHLLEIILLLTELEELTASMETPAKGVIIESHLDSRRGLTATLIIQDGELKIGDWVSTGPAYGRAKSLEDFTGKNIQVAVASQPCLMLAWETAPAVGQEFKVVSNLKEAERLALGSTTIGPAPLFLQELSVNGGGKKSLNLIIKADVQSSLEAIDHVLRTIKSEEVGYKVVGFGVGNITDADIKNARATQAMVIGFHVSVDPAAKRSAEREKVRVETFDVIYNLVENVRLIMSELLEPETRRIPLGKTRVLALFSSKSTSSQIVGGKVIQGKAVRGALIDVVRDDAVIAKGRLAQLQQNKVDITEVSEGYELGIRFEPFGSQSTLAITIGDILEIYEEEKIKRSI